MSSQALDLVGQIVAANVSSLAATTDRIIEDQQRQIRELAQTIVDIDGVLDNALVIDRRTERRLDDLRLDMDRAHWTLQNMVARA